MMAILLSFFIGCVLLWKGGDLLIDGASAVAKRLSLPEFVVGFTFVAFGTSLPELVVNTMAVLHGSTEIVFGNVIGSNISNVLLILGVVALFGTVHFTGILFSKDLVLGIASTAFFIALLYMHPSLPGFLGLQRYSSLLLLVLFIWYLWRLFCRHGKEESPDPILHHSSRPFLRFLIGLSALLAGGHLVVESATDIATLFQVSEGLVGLLLVALGTSLPELVAGVAAVAKGKSDMVVGNVLGSNMFNLCWILGVCGLLSPLPISMSLLSGAWILLAVMMGLFILLLLPVQREINMRKGLILLLAYGLYLYSCIFLLY